MSRYQFCAECPRQNLQRLVGEAYMTDTEIYNIAGQLASRLLEIVPCEGKQSVRHDGEEGSYDIESCGNPNADNAETILAHTKLGIKRAGLTAVHSEF